MRKLVFAILALLMLSGCDTLKDNNNVETIEFSHKGHKYLKFLYSTHVADTGTVHDPDCDCFKSKETVNVSPSNGIRTPSSP